MATKALKYNIVPGPADTGSMNAGDWKDRSGFCFVDSFRLSDPVSGAHLYEALTNVEDEIDGRAALRAFEDPANADAISWDDLKAKLGL